MIEKTINGIHDQNVAKPHVVVIPYPSQGHINPLLQFAKRLASKGIKATIATPKHTLSSFSSLENIVFEPISDGFENRGSPEVGSEDLFLSAFKSNGSISLSRIIETHQNSAFPVTCVVYDAFLPWALDVAKEYGLLGAAFFTNSAAVCSIFCCVSHGLIELPLNPDKVKSVLPKMPLFKGNDFPTFLRKPETYPAYLTMKLSQFSNLHLADWMFCNSFDDLEIKVIEGVQDKWAAKMIGPMVPSSYLDGRIEGDIGYGSSLWKPLSEKCKEWLKTKPKKSVIYVSFGSMVSLTQQQTEEIALALKQSNYNFLWVVRETQMSKLPKGFEQELCMTKKGIIVTWCNQLEILGHEAVACFVTHCGWNSTLEGLSLGIPMVGVPQWSDQLPDAKFIEEVWGVGVWAKEDDKGVVRKEILVDCLKEVMEGEKGKKIRENAIKWRELSKKAVDNGGSSDKHIEDFVQHLRCNCFAKTKSNGFH